MPQNASDVLVGGGAGGGLRNLDPIQGIDKKPQVSNALFY